MDTFVEAIASFEKIHSWWSDETFLKADNATLKKFVQNMIHISEYTSELAVTGTAESMEELVTILKMECPKMVMVTLMNFLDYLFSFDIDGKPYSKELVAWYRGQGWQFPPFSHEEEADADSETDSETESEKIEPTTDPVK